MLFKSTNIYLRRTFNHIHIERYADTKYIVYGIAWYYKNTPHMWCLSFLILFIKYKKRFIEAYMHIVYILSRIYMWGLFVKIRVNI